MSRGYQIARSQIGWGLLVIHTVGTLECFSEELCGISDCEDSLAAYQRVELGLDR